MDLVIKQFTGKELPFTKIPTHEFDFYGCWFQIVLTPVFHAIGFILRVPLLNKITREQYFDDSLFWELPADIQTQHQEPNKTAEGDGKTVEAFVYDNSCTDMAEWTMLNIQIQNL